MIKITFFKKGSVYYGFRETGHAEYDEPGKDIVCSAVSAMTMLVMNTIEVAYSSPIDYSIDDETADVEVYAYGALGENGEDEKLAFAISGLLLGYYIQLTDMLDDYSDYLEVGEEET